jgi:hypothetical protein
MALYLLLDSIVSLQSVVPESFEDASPQVTDMAGLVRLTEAYLPGETLHPSPRFTSVPFDGFTRGLINAHRS